MPNYASNKNKNKELLAKLIANERIKQERGEKLNSIFLYGNDGKTEGKLREKWVEGGLEIAFAVVAALLNSVGNNTFLTPNSGSGWSKGFSGR